MSTPASIPGVTASLPMSNAASPSELFALTDEQILEIDSDLPSSSSDAVIPNAARNPSSSRTAEPALQSKRDSSSPTAPRNDGSQYPTQPDSATKHESPITSHASEPPPWLARMMNDPWTGDEARDLWNGVQQAQQEAAVYREVFAKPEDARALKELYPGGVEQARAAAERSRTMEEIDAAFYGGAGKSPEQLSAGRAALAQRMLREDPAAFREMVFAGLRALEGAQTPSPAPTAGRDSPSVGAALGSPANRGQASTGGASPANTAAPDAQDAAQNAAQNAHLAQYTAFEKSANEELEKSVGGAINRALQQALPASAGRDGRETVGARYIVPLQQRLGVAIRQDVESALKGDRQLGEQIAQVLSARRFDDTTRAQVVRLINDRAQQLVPVAARRVIQDWTQTAFAAHRGRASSGSADQSDNGAFASAAISHAAQGNSTRNAGSSGAQAASPTGSASRPASNSISEKTMAANRAEKSVDMLSRAPRGRAVDYRKLSDEQILDL